MKWSGGAAVPKRCKTVGVAGVGGIGTHMVSCLILRDSQVSCAEGITRRLRYRQPQPARRPRYDARVVAIQQRSTPRIVHIPALSHDQPRLVRSPAEDGSVTMSASFVDRYSATRSTPAKTMSKSNGHSSTNPRLSPCPTSNHSEWMSSSFRPRVSSRRGVSEQLLSSKASQSHSTCR